MSSSAHTAVPGTAAATEAGFVSAYPEAAFLPAARCAEEIGVTLSCVSLPAVAHHALLIRLVPYTGQQETHPRAAAIVYNFKCMVPLTGTPSVCRLDTAPSGPALHLQL